MLDNCFSIGSFIPGEFAMKDKLLIWLIIVGLGIAYIGIKYQNPIIVGLAIGGAGAYGIFAGFQMIISRRGEEPTSGGGSAHKEYHTGITAQLWGFLYILFGMITILIALGMSISGETSKAWVDAFFAKPSGMGWFMTAAGGMILLFGIIRLISGNASYTETKLVPFERITGGISFFLLGLVILSAGLWLIISPSSLRHFLNFSSR
jgi:hypothetical protein